MAEWLEELREGEAESGSQSAQGGDADVPLPTFNPTHIVPVQVGPLRQLLLGDPHLLTELANSLTDSGWEVPAHAAMLSA